MLQKIISIYRNLFWKFRCIGFRRLIPLDRLKSRIMNKIIPGIELRLQCRDVSISGIHFPKHYLVVILQTVQFQLLWMKNENETVDIKAQKDNKNGR